MVVRCLLFVPVFLGSFVPAHGDASKNYCSAAKSMVSEAKGQPCDVAAKLGQLLYVNVDGFGSSETIDPAYIRLVTDLNVGGVLPHVNSADPVKIRDAFAKLQKSTELPLFIGNDYLSLQPNKDIRIEVGLGWGPGYLKDYGKTNSDCHSAYTYIDAFLHRAMGINHALGPTIEQTKGHGFLEGDPETVGPVVDGVINTFDHFGLATTMKHFPYTPAEYNIHDKTVDTRTSEADVKNRIQIFKHAASRADFAMSTHLMNSNIDPSDVATFSKKWVHILRKDVGFGGLLMTDGMRMFNAYDDQVKQMAAKWPKDLDKPDIGSIFVARAFLAGHDIAIVEGTADDTCQSFVGVAKVACSDHPFGKALRERIDESFQRIVAYKQIHSNDLRPTPVPSNQLILEGVKLHDKIQRYKSKGLDDRGCLDWTQFQNFKDKVEILGYQPKAKSKLPPATIAEPTTAH